MNMTPTYDALIMTFLIDTLKFTKIDLANLSCYSTIFYILALYLYQIYLKKVSSKIILLGTNFLLCFTNIIFMLVVLGYS